MTVPHPESAATPDRASGPLATEGNAPAPGGPADLTAVRAAVVRFRAPCHATEFAIQALELVAGSQVIVETDRGTRLGSVVAIREHATAPPAHSVLRIATEDDLDAHRRNCVREREAFVFCAERIRALGLPMKLVGAEFAHSGSSAVFSFSSAERVDFRALVKDLARRFHTRIDMRQIGVRDVARVCGGIGACGRELCCSTFLFAFNPISVRMAKDQSLALNQDKLSGVCGRLKCCLAYEESAYAELRRGLPKLGKRVITPAGEGRVKDVDVIKRVVRVQLTDGRYLEFPGDQVKRPLDAGEPHPVAHHDQANHPVTAPPAAGSALPGPAASSAAATAPVTDGSQPPARKRRRRRRRGHSTGNAASRPGDELTPRDTPPVPPKER